jgi:hypothetical protein
MYLDDPPGWKDITADVRAANDIVAKRGFRGGSVPDRVASTGTLSFALNNAESNSASLLGYYSPDNANCRTGFELGARARFSITYAGITIYKFHGRVASIQPTAGSYRDRITYVIARCYMEQIRLAKTHLLPVQINKRADQLITTLIGSMTIAPLDTDYATGPDTFAYALHSERDEQTSIMTALQKIAQSGLDYVFVRGDDAGGELLTYQSRHSRVGAASLATLDNTMYELTITRSVDRIYTIIKVVGYPGQIDADPTTILSSLQREIELGPGKSTTITMRYRDPAGAATRISGTEMTDPLVADDNYKMSSISGDGGNDLNDDLSITPDYGGNSADILLENTGLQTGYINKIDLTGKGIYLYDPIEITKENPDEQADYNDRVLTFTLPYQDNPNVVKDFANEIARRVKGPTSDIGAASFVANTNVTLMEYARDIDIGDRITLSENVTGFADEDFNVNGVEYRVTDGGKILRCTWGPLEDAIISLYWMIGIEGLSEIGITTVFGF